MVRNNFNYLLVGLLLLLGLEPFLEGAANSGALIQLAFTSVLTLGVLSLARNRWAFQLGVGLVTIGFIAAAGYWWTGSVVLRVIDLVAIVGFCVLAIGVMLRQVLFGPGTVTSNQIVGALCIYVLLGLLWAMLFALVEIIEPAAFHYGGPQASDAIEQFIYYSFVTLTTLGYGDIMPVHPVARTLAYLEAVIGQLYLTVLIASLVGQHVATRSSRTQA